MTVVVDIRAPYLQQVDGGAAIRVHLGEHSVLVSTREEARALIDAFGRAFCYLDERERLIASRLDRDTAQLVNEIHAEINREWPGGGFQQVYEGAPPAPVVALNGCECQLPCSEHGGAA